jgi:hypothetical protein
LISVRYPNIYFKWQYEKQKRREIMKKDLTFCLLASLVASGCGSIGGFSQMQDAVSKFDQGAHSVGTGQMAFFRAVQTADCDSAFFDQAYQFSQHLSDTVDLSGACKPTILDDGQIAIRQLLVNTITTYADKMQALATADDNKTLDANAESLASEANASAKQNKLSGFANAPDIEAAIIGLTEMVLDQKRFDDIHQKAHEMQPQLTTVIKALESENVSFAVGFASKIDGLRPKLRGAILAARDQRKQASILDVIQARDLVRIENPFGAEPLSQTPGGQQNSQNAGYVVDQLNKALESMLNANDALAKTGTGGLNSAVNNLISRGQHVNSILSDLKK